LARCLPDRRSEGARARPRISGAGDFPERVQFGALPVAQRSRSAAPIMQTLPRLLDHLPPRVHADFRIARALRMP
jgi:hypothetical protein